MNHRTVLMLGVLVGVLAIAGGRFQAMYDDPSILRPFDYMEYWAAGRAQLEGLNPYDGSVLYPLQQQMGTKYKDPVMMWNPPWTLPPAMVVGAMHWRAGQLLWFAMNLGAVAVSAAMLWRIYGGQPHLLPVAFAAAAVFAPTSFLLLLGQISGLLLLGLVGFLWAIRNERYAIAGSVAALTAIKPHLLVPFALVLALQTLRGTPTWKSVAAGGLALVIFGVIPLPWNPEVWSQYREAMTATSSPSHPTPRDWIHATAGYQLRQALPGQPFEVMFVPLVLAVPFTVIYWRLRQTWDWEIEMPRLVLLSLLAAPYGAWGFDLVLLLVPVIQAATWIAADERRWVWVKAGGVYLALNLIALSTLTQEGSMANPWIVPMTTAGYLLAGWFTRNHTPRQPRTQS
jgi:hypothetical protein